MEALVIAEKYDLEMVQNSCFKVLRNKSLDSLQADPCFKHLGRENLMKLLILKCEVLENKLEDAGEKYKHIKKESQRYAEENKKLKTRISQIQGDDDYYTEKVYKIKPKNRFSRR